ncbi:response regulator transcription factor [Halalkalibacter sp. APA_J-10(15)]|uniref:response regulator transcription factor n=1 Tax=unclassified Halalkalibacter TaxID=2893063 RepID=UPI001FF1D0FC|nr:response regulator transcription factor [Halalkalibacter sp. APA_J-10(15)]MCK0470620.1 response regulator transcription factor [Halalkalibacter sp. APA_J-10(15)]
MMYKVLIVDDERTVREGLNSLIPWEDYGFQVVGLAKDAETAYSLFRELSPDLVISDIRMYGMNGLDLIKRLREINKVFQCIILSGYADFDYAKRAIQNNVAGYLLKPIYEEELIEYLEKVKKELSKQQAVTELTESEETRKREQYVLSLIGSDHHFFSEKEANQFGLDWDRYQVLLMKVDNSFEMDTDMFKIKREVEFLINKDVALFVSEPYVGLVLNASEYRMKEVQQLYQELKLSLDSYAHSITYSIGQVVESLNDVHQSYKSAFQMIQRKFFYPKEQLLSDGMQIDIQYSEGQFEVTDIIDNMYFALDLGVYESLRETTNDMFKWAMQDLSERNVKKNIVYVMTTVFNKLQKSKEEKEEFFTSMLEKVLELYQQPSFEDVKKVVNEMMNDVLNELEYADSDHQLKKLLLLIENKYNENLKLEQLAKLFNYNSAYLGKLFKSYTGEYFNTYLDKVRIKNAKKLLLQGQKVYRVAEIVGYNNVDYFHSKFKKYEGVSPSAYKRKMIKSD